MAMTSYQYMCEIEKLLKSVCELEEDNAALSAYVYELECMVEELQAKVEDLETELKDTEEILDLYREVHSRLPLHIRRRY